MEKVGDYSLPWMTSEYTALAFILALNFAIQLSDPRTGVDLTLHLILRSYTNNLISAGNLAGWSQWAEIPRKRAKLAPVLSRRKWEKVLTDLANRMLMSVAVYQKAGPKRQSCFFGC